MAIDTPRRGRTPVVQHRTDFAGRLIDCQILAGYAEQAIQHANCPENAAPVSVASEAIGKLRSILRTLSGQFEEAVS